MNFINTTGGLFPNENFRTFKENPDMQIARLNWFIAGCLVVYTIATWVVQRKRKSLEEEARHRELEAVRDQLTTLQGRNKQLEVDLVTERFKSCTQPTRSQLESKIAILKTDLQTCKLENAILRTESEDAKKKAGSTRQSWSQMNRIGNLEMFRKLGLAREKVEAKNRELSDQLEQSRKGEKETKRTLEHVTKEKMQWEKTKKNLKAELESTTRQVDDQERRIQELSETLAVREMRIQELSETLAVRERKLEEVTGCQSALEGMVTMFKEREGRWETELMKAQARVSELSLEVEAWRGQEEHYRQVADEVTAKNGEMEGVIRNLNEQLRLADDHINEVEGRLEAGTLREEENGRQRETLLREKEELKAQVEEMRDLADEQARNFCGVLEERNRRIQDLQEELNECVGQCECVQRKLEEQAREKAELEGTRNRNLVRVQELEGEIGELREVIEETEADLIKVSDKLQILQSALQEDKGVFVETITFFNILLRGFTNLDSYSYLWNM